MSKISRAQETPDVTMGNPSKGKTHQEKSFLYNEEPNTRVTEAILKISSSKTSMLNQHLQYQVSLQEYMPLSHRPHQMNTTVSQPTLLPRDVTKKP